jgi:signal transduction histidine kinase
MIQVKASPTLLIADDQPDNLKAIQDILKTSPYQFNFITVPNGKVLVEMALRKLPDLIITDWEMPEMDGLSAIKTLKGYPQTADIPIIMCTGIMTSSENLKTIMEAGAVDYVRKPIEANELIARVQSMLQLSASFTKIKEQKEELEKSNALKSRLLSVVSHDVRGPLNQLQGLFYLFEAKALSLEETREIINQISFQVGQVSDFLENLLNWAKNQLKTIEPQPSRFQLNSIAKLCVSLLAPSAERKGIILKQNLDDFTIISADEEMIKTVIRNLISNAIKFCRARDTIELSITNDKINHQITFACKDSGVGISSDKIQKLFGMENISTKGTGNEIGTGLGLLLSKQFMELNGGKIFVESEEGKGSHFWFTLPLS